MTHADEQRVNPTCVIGLGASAGGLEALDAFFSAMPDTTGMAFVVIQHLAPDYKSLMAELLAKHTGMEVLRAEEGMEVAANQVYIIPPRKNLRLFHGKLLLSEQVRNQRGVNLPIDVFFESLAEDQGVRSVGVILSGTGSDGARGIRAIKEKGGMVMVQTPESSRFDGMPRSAVATGLADFILPVEEMPDRLQAFVAHPYICQTAPVSPLLQDEDRLARVFALLRDQNKVDFTSYKQNTIVRRIERRMTVNQVDNLADYVALLETRRAEVSLLYRDLLIGVTSFFRDPQVWQELRDRHLPALFRDRPAKSLRMWVPGCSTGEEAYTLAMLCRDWMEEQDQRFDLKIFATDIDREAVSRASQGLYPEAVAADLTPGLVTRYFVRQGDRLQVMHHLREMVVFAQHNLITDPPFTKLDLVSCRNLLIYLQPVLQEKVMDGFNFALKPQGLLLLGTSETAGGRGDYFECLDSKQKIFRSRGWARPAPHGGGGAPNPRWSVNADRPRGIRVTLGGREEEHFFNRLLGTLAKGCLPLAVVVNEQLEVVYTLGDSRNYLTVPQGKVKNEITRMLIEDLAIPVATGLRRTFERKEVLHYTNIRIRRGEATEVVNLHIRPLDGRQGQEPLALFYLQEVPEASTASPGPEGKEYDPNQATEQRIADLEQELQFTRENLQATIEELETSNEELQATNEELLASNEELQSTNEELQSVNEELHTVNAEYQQKIVELTQLYNDFDSMLSSSRIYTLFLDENLEVRKFTPDTDSVIPLRKSDLGRPFEHIRHQLVGVDPLQLVREVEESGRSREVEARTGDGRWFLMRVLPYRITDSLTSGVVLTLVEITDLKEIRQDLQASENRFAQLFETLDEGVVYQDLEGRITEANAAAQELLGMSLDQMRGVTSLDPAWRALHPDGSEWPGEDHPAMRALRTGEPVRNALMGVYNPRDEAHRWLLISSTPIHCHDTDRVSGVYTRIVGLDEQEAAARRAQETGSK